MASSPTGAPLTYAGTTANAPWVRNAAVDFVSNIGAAPSFVSGGTTYEFAGWSDGGQRSHQITIPSSDLTLTATYRPQVWFEGEAMTITTADTTAVRVIAEGNTSGGNTMGYRKSPSSAQMQYTTVGYPDAMILRMRADTCQGPPTATVTIDNQAPRNIDVDSTTYTDYSLPLIPQNGGTPGTHTVKVEFLNNLVNSTCDRNIYLDKITLHQADNQPLGGYARAKAATPMYAPLVPSYSPCGTANRQHGGGLSMGSCNPPVATSPNLTVGTPDSNGAEANMTGSYRATVCEGGPCGTGDVILAFSATDIRCAGGYRALRARQHVERGRLHRGAQGHVEPADHGQAQRWIWHGRDGDRRGQLLPGDGALHRHGGSVHRRRLRSQHQRQRRRSGLDLERRAGELGAGRRGRPRRWPRRRRGHPRGQRGLPHPGHLRALTQSRWFLAYTRGFVRVGWGR